MSGSDVFEISARRSGTFSSLFVFLLCSLGSAHAQSRIDCSALNSQILKQVVHYCVYLPAGYDAPAPTQQRSRSSLSGALFPARPRRQRANPFQQRRLDPARRSAPPAARSATFSSSTPEGRRSFYINSADGSVRYSDFFLQEFIPHIEAKYRIRPGRASRAQSAESLWAAMARCDFAFAHPEMFSAVSAQSAALITETPEELDAAAQSGAPMGEVLTAVFGDPIDVRHWNENNPVRPREEKCSAALHKLSHLFQLRTG